MNYKISFLILAVFGSLIACEDLTGAENTNTVGDVCSRSPDLQLEITPEELFVSWKTASPEYAATYRLIPVIVVSGNVIGDEVGGTKKGQVFLQFWPSALSAKATWTGPDPNDFYFNYPFSHIESVMRIVEGSNKFRILYRVQDGRCSGLIEVAKRKIPFLESEE